jgi:hypothetical protein
MRQFWRYFIKTDSSSQDTGEGSTGLTTEETRKIIVRVKTVSTTVIRGSNTEL